MRRLVSLGDDKGRHEITQLQSFWYEGLSVSQVHFLRRKNKEKMIVGKVSTLRVQLYQYLGNGYRRIRSSRAASAI